MKLVIALLLLLIAIIGAMFIAINKPSSSNDLRRSAVEVQVPPANADWDYRLGEPKAPAANVGIVSRDRTVKPAVGR